ncbi:UNVERIFIED_CONTAM: Nucleolar protein 58, partial [Eudyptes robustus]
MLVLFDTPAGYAIFKVLDESKLKKEEKVFDYFAEADSILEKLQLVSFKKFKDVNEALKASTSVADESKIGKTLKKLIQKAVAEGDELAVGDSKIGSLLKENLEVSCVHNKVTDELFRAIRANIDHLLAEHKTEVDAMRLALAHSLGRYRVKFNPEKIDTMIVQAVSLLDDLDKELNNYVMRCREWYGWHFPELGKLVQDHLAFAKVVKAMGMKQNANDTDFSTILPDELAEKLRQEAEISMGTEISEIDLIHISQLCDQIIDLTEYRSQLHDYLKNRMGALAPNLTVLLGELIGARLISRAGTLVNLAKYPASTVQILGAEKALFRALKTKAKTPKYGIIYHAQLIGQAPTELKGKFARKLAAKVSLATRVDALCDDTVGNEVGVESRTYLEAALDAESKRQTTKKVNATFSGAGYKDKYAFKSNVRSYDAGADSNVAKKRKWQSDGDTPTNPRKVKKEEQDE